MMKIICRLYVENVIPKRLQWKMAVLETEKNKLLTRRIKMYKLKYGLDFGKKMSPNRFLVYQALDIETNLKERMII